MIRLQQKQFIDVVKEQKKLVIELSENGSFCLFVPSEIVGSDDFVLVTQRGDIRYFRSLSVLYSQFNDMISNGVDIALTTSLC